MKAETVKTKPIEGQKPGTSGLRKKTRVFMSEHFLENFVQSIFNAIGGVSGKRFVVGGDGRYFNAEAIQTIIKMAVSQGAAELIIGQKGLLSTPAASHLIRLNKTDGGFILSASHNPGGIDQDFGLKFNASNGGPAPENLTEQMFEESLKISAYRISKAADVDLNTIGETTCEDTKITVVDPVSDYVSLMDDIFDFGAIASMIEGGFTLCFDAMHAVTGPYAVALLEERLGAPSGSVINSLPLPDFGGGHPDPNPTWAEPLIDLMTSKDAPDFGAASDGDGDRNMIVGRHAYVTPSDSLAVLAANAHLVPAYKNGLAGVARSMPTSGAVDRVAEVNGIDCFETPTGWKFFGNLLDAGKITLCGEESAGTGSDHVREKDGLWAVLMWLNILAVRKQSVSDVMTDHWTKFGRDFYARLDFETVDADNARNLMDSLEHKLPELAGKTVEGQTIRTADMFSYTDPVDGSVSNNQGLRITFDSGARAVLRLSGTGTEGATIRLYLEQFSKAENSAELDRLEQLSDVRKAIIKLAEFQNKIGRTEPDVIS